ncbi:MAG: hypothetical protein WKH64_03615 [Chloroflexia bacterium]
MKPILYAPGSRCSRPSDEFERLGFGQLPLGVVERQRARAQESLNPRQRELDPVGLRLCIEVHSVLDERRARPLARLTLLVACCDAVHHLVHLLLRTTLRPRARSAGCEPPLRRPPGSIVQQRKAPLGAGSQVALVRAAPCCFDYSRSLF